MTGRLAKLQAAMRPAGVDVLAVVPGANMRYLTGLEIHSSERIAIAFFSVAGTPAMVLPDAAAPGATLVTTAGDDFEDLRHRVFEAGLDAHAQGGRRRRAAGAAHPPNTPASANTPC